MEGVDAGGFRLAGAFDEEGIGTAAYPRLLKTRNIIRCVNPRVIFRVRTGVA